MTYVKICGLTNLEDARAAAEAGADYLGFIFYPHSPRYVSPEHAREIISALRHAFPVHFVGVFVNERVEQVRHIAALGGVDLVQLHGDEPPQALREFGSGVYKSIRAQTMADARAIVEQYSEALRGNTPAFIVDAFTPNSYGGTGARADWTIAREIAVEFPILLAGGLSPDNAVEAVEAVHPWGVDVSSGVERAPGLKDHAKVREFVAKSKEQPRDGEKQG